MIGVSLTSCLPDTTAFALQFFRPITRYLTLGAVDDVSSDAELDTGHASLTYRLLGAKTKLMLDELIQITTPLLHHYFLGRYFSLRHEHDDDG